MIATEPTTEARPCSIYVPPLRGFSIASVFIFGFVLFGVLDRVRANPRLFWSFMGAVAVLLAWSAVLFGSAWCRRRRLTLEFVPRPQHYLQACLQTAIFAYWGWYWRQVYDSYYLVIAQLVFAYAFDLLLSWSRRDHYSPSFLIFLIGLPAQYLFGVTTMTMPAVMTTYLFGLAYYRATGVYFFFDSYIPISVFFGMHLLFTDPSTAPRTELGRMIFGSLYGLGNVALYYVLHSAGVPEFYDKLLPVPILNVMIQLIDRAAGSELLRRFDPSGFGRSLVGRRRNLAYIALWTIVFAMTSAAQGVGDKHPGQFVPFWQRACGEARVHA